MNPGKLNKKIEIWKNENFQTELLEEDTKDELVKKVYSQIIPISGMMKTGQAETLIVGSTHKIRMRYNTGKFITPDMWFVYKNTKYNIKYILNPFESNRTLEFFCEVIVKYE